MERWRPWGKLNRTADGRVLVHFLLDHMVDVAAVLFAMLKLPAVHRALECAAGRSLSDTDRARLAVLAFLHDIGKANTGFQVRYWRVHAERPSAWTVAECGHGPQGWALFGSGMREAARVTAGLPFESMAAWGEAARSLLHASISHHGRPVAEDAAFTIWHPIRDGSTLVYDPAEAVSDMGSLIQRLYPEAFVADMEELPDAPAFSHLYAGLMQFADWLGSDTRAGFFPYTELGEDRATTAPLRARHALQAVGLDVGDEDARLAATVCNFAQAFNLGSPREMQADMGTDCLGPIVVLEAETGSGKTEAALWRFLHLWRAGQVDGLYFALPTRVAASQMYERVQAFVSRVWPKNAPVVVRALPGYTAADSETSVQLPDFRVQWSDYPGDAEAERRWAAESPKRYLAATIAVGTVDQVLLGALKVKHAHLRKAMLTRSLLVVDEVHASDTYMTRLLEHLLRAHVACGGQALLLSATLGATARARFLSIGGARPEPSPSLAQAQAVPYPSIGYRAASGPALRPVVGNPRQKIVQWEAWDQIDAPAAIAARALEAAAAGARVLVVRNTVRDAIATLLGLEALAPGRDYLFQVGGQSTLHHGNFSRQDRPLLDAAVHSQMGKHRSPRAGLVVIGTQTLEQSLDIDADLLITDLCPMDVLLQRLGRLHRHERPGADTPDDLRPVGFEEPRAWVLTPAAHDLAPMLKRQRHGLGPVRREGSIEGVYVDVRVLEATRRLIAADPRCTIPAANRLLVERATHPEALDAITRELGEPWIRFGQECDGALSAQGLFATYHALPFDQPFDEPFPEGDRRVGSRLGATDRVVVFDSPPLGPFGKRVEQLALRHYLVPPGLADDAGPTDVLPLSEGPGFTFLLGTTPYRYSRFGVQRVHERPSQ